ncbi:DUF11 domain-containing protein [Kangiella sp. HZ709]|uniref:DUF11 domain-containing protein n=1 Tax=Kangiella sp. HZ709 TaxID=2666328 RepID=UPI0012B00A3D|nr:DUF11 domain-containing protein [Kangiella sp. HZ709]MRX26636.1 DUF11 domain-containing protein [Kangiella sp. HZ709]
MIRIFLFILLCLVHFSVSAVTITQTYTNNTNADVDPNSTSPVFRDIVIPAADFPTGTAITDVNVQIRFDKRDEGAANDGVCRNHQGGGVFNNEIGFVVTAPDGTSVNIVTANSGYYSGATRPGVIVVNYDDEGAVFTGTTPTAGTFQPEGNLSDFDQSTNIGGTWRLTMSDSAGQDPLCFRRFRLTVEASNEADISVTKNDSTTIYTPGGTSSYTIVVSNGGPIDVTGLQVSDPIPTGVSLMSWSCTPSAGASCTAAGTGAINQLVDIPDGGTVTYTVNVTYSTTP